jgi:hypothetical protein
MINLDATVVAVSLTAVLHRSLDSFGPVVSGGRDHAALVRSVVAGDLSGAVSSAPEAARNSLHALVMASFGDGFQAILLVAAAFAAFSALLTWTLVRQKDTAPVERKSRPLRSDAINLVNE